MSDVRQYVQMYIADLADILANCPDDEAILEAAREAFGEADGRYKALTVAAEAMKKGGFGRYKDKRPSNQPTHKCPPNQATDG